jgi:hypothetical protein
MKNLLMVTALAFVGFSACGQKLDASKVPAPVKASFAKQYPNLAVKWEKEGVKYEANFKLNGSTMSALYESGGALTETEMDIKITDLPAAVTAYVKEHYAGKKIKEAAKLTNADGSVNYEAEVNGTDVIFDANGKFIKEVKEKD